MNEPHKQMKFTFTCSEKQAVDFKIRIKYDGLTQSSFFQEVLDLYLSNEGSFLPVLKKIKLKKAKMGKAKIESSLREIRRGKKIIKDLALSDLEKESLFDLIEEDH